jgi:lipoprotein-anchoring transpeptidase ErfK/SrfK
MIAIMNDPGCPMRINLQLVAIMTCGIISALTSAPAQARETVNFSGVSADTIVIKTSERRLYFVLGNGQALRYPVGVGRAGKQWSGTSFIDGKYIKPAWSPPAVVKRDKPYLHYVAGGSPHNPMGAAAMTLHGGEYAIHGTNVPNTVGGFVSYGCFRMYNQDILDLFSRVSVGTRVVVER